MAATLATARSIHFGACLLLWAVLALDQWIVGPILPAGVSSSVPDPWRSIVRTLVLACLPLMLLSGATWFVLVALDMNGSTWSDLPAWGTLYAVWSTTHFGWLCKWRLMLLLAVLISVEPVLRRSWGSSVRTLFRRTSLLSAGLLVISLAGVGHGQIGVPPTVHLLADAIHLLAAGFWPLGLIPFALLFRKWKRSADLGSASLLYALTQRFSFTSLASVGVLMATGLVNSWFLLGSFSNLWTTSYGRLLLIKIAVFIVMVGLGAANLLWFKPRLAPSLNNPDRSIVAKAAELLSRNVLMEIVLTIVILAIVGVLGMLSPGVVPGSN